MAEQSIAEIESALSDEFIEIIPNLSEWGKAVDEQIQTALNDFITDNRVKMMPSFRIKTLDSFIVKALYRKKTYKNHIQDIEDKVGTRVVLLTTDDVMDATTVLEQSGFWNCKVGKDYREQVHDFPELFTYQSMHLTVSPKDNFLKDKSLIPLLTCEIQIRTLLQHAYAETSHDSSYKGPYKNDREMLRVLAKSMALMESTDEYFCRIFTMMKDDSRKYKNYLNELTTRYVQFSPSYQVDSAQIAVIDSIFSLLSKKDVPIKDLETFIEQQKSWLKGAISPKNGYLFQQPTILLVAYYLENYESFLRENWPLSSETLKSTYQSFGVSFGGY